MTIYLLPEYRMANPDHLNTLKKGSTAWNSWRRDHPHTLPDLSDLNMRGARLGTMNLTAVNFQRSDLREVDFREAPLRWADLRRATLSWANLEWCDLREANLQYVDCRAARLLGGNLRSANLRDASFHSSDLRRVDLTDGILGHTTFADIDLGQVKGLESIRHDGPSYLDISTIFRSHGNIPDIFLRGAGVPDRFIDFAHSLIGQSLNFYSCFISFSSHDHDFTERLHKDLQNNGVRCWFAPEDLRIGDKFRLAIHESIRMHDKLLLVLSKHAISSAWVEDEVETALARERREG